MFIREYRRHRSEIIAVRFDPSSLDSSLRLNGIDPSCDLPRCRRMGGWFYKYVCERRMAVSKGIYSVVQRVVVDGVRGLVHGHVSVEHD